MNIRPCRRDTTAHEHVDPRYFLSLPAARVHLLLFRCHEFRRPSPDIEAFVTALPRA